MASPTCLEHTAAILASRVTEFLSIEPNRAGASRRLTKMEEALFAFNEARILNRPCGSCPTCEMARIGRGKE